MHAVRTRRTPRIAALVAAAIAVTGQLVGGASAARAVGSLCAAHAAGAAQVDRFGGIVRPSLRISCARAAARTTRSAEPPYEPGTRPPLHLQNDTAKVMATDPTTPLTLTPIFWTGRSGSYSFATSYTNLIQQYIGDVAADSGLRSNVFASLTQYYLKSAQGRRHVHYEVQGRDVTIGTPYLVRDSLPRTCAVGKGRIYHNDPVGYTTCVADTDIAHEVQRVLQRQHWTADMNHLYAIFLPKHVEVCFYRGNPGDQQCSVNNGRSSAFCAYHSYAKGAPQAIYATLPFPVYRSPTGSSCSAEFQAPDAGYPNHTPDADVVLSGFSHEVSEAITDPKLTAWIARDGTENGDLCSDIYGAFAGPSGAMWNQTINGHHYLTQEEFSNKEYAPGLGGCVQDENVPTLTSLSVGGTSGQTVTLHGTGFRPGHTTVLFGTTRTTDVVGTTTTVVKVTAPPNVSLDDVRVRTPNGTSAAISAGG